MGTASRDRGRPAMGPAGDLGEGYLYRSVVQLRLHDRQRALLARLLGLQRSRVLAEALDVAQLDVLVAADDVGELGQAQRDVRAVEGAVDEVAVLAGERAAARTGRAACRA